MCSCVACCYARSVDRLIPAVCSFSSMPGRDVSSILTRLGRDRAPLHSRAVESAESVRRLKGPGQSGVKVQL